MVLEKPASALPERKLRHLGTLPGTGHRACWEAVVTALVSSGGVQETGARLALTQALVAAFMERAV